VDTAETTECWCRAASYPEGELIRLGRHPQVAVCGGCARWLHRQATARHDREDPSPAGQLRAGIRAVRSAVTERGWHDRPHLGRLLRRFDRHLP
jgi:hypothetical protein